MYEYRLRCLKCTTSCVFITENSEELCPCHKCLTRSMCVSIVDILDCSIRKKSMEPLIRRLNREQDIYG